PSRVVERPLLLPRRRSGEEVVRELREVRVEIVCVCRLEHLTRLSMKLEPSRRGEPLVEGVADQGVCEARTVPRTRDLRDDALDDRFVQSLQHLSPWTVAEPSERFQPKLPA